MSFWLYFSTSIIASTAVFVEAAKGSGEMSLVRECGIRGSVPCEEEKKKVEIQQIPIFMPLISCMQITQH